MSESESGSETYEDTWNENSFDVVGFYFCEDEMKAEPSCAKLLSVANLEMKRRRPRLALALYEAVLAAGAAASDRERTMAEERRERARSELAADGDALGDLLAAKEAAAKEAAATSSFSEEVGAGIMGRAPACQTGAESAESCAGGAISRDGVDAEAGAEAEAGAGAVGGGHEGERCARAELEDVARQVSPAIVEVEESVDTLGGEEVKRLSESG